MKCPICQKDQASLSGVYYLCSHIKNPNSLINYNFVENTYYDDDYMIVINYSGGRRVFVYGNWKTANSHLFVCRDDDRTIQLRGNNIYEAAKNYKRLIVLA